MLRLVGVRGDGTPAVCRTAEQSEFDDDEWELVEYFVDERLLMAIRDAVGNLTVRIVHEALLSRWERLAGWIEDDSKRLVAANEVREEAARWVSRDCDEAWLLRKQALADARAWVNDPLSSVDRLSMEFVVKSITAEKSARRVSEAVELSERTDNVALRVAALGAAIRVLLANLEPWAAFSYWRRLWQYEDGLRPVESGDEWRKATNSIGEIFVQSIPVLITWPICWFGIAYFAVTAVNYGHYVYAAMMGFTMLTALVVLYRIRSALRHFVVILPYALILAVFVALVPMASRPQLFKVMTDREWSISVGAVALFIYCAIAIYVDRRYARGARHEQ